MQKAHLYEAILLVNRGVDEAVRGLERLKRARIRSSVPRASMKSSCCLRTTVQGSIPTSAARSNARSSRTLFDLKLGIANTRRTPWTKSRSIGTCGSSKSAGVPRETAQGEVLYAGRAT